MTSPDAATAAELDAQLRRASWVGMDPHAVPEFFPPIFDDRPGIARDLPPGRLLRTTFALDVVPDEAWLAATARGVYRAFLNGVRVGDDELAPGWTDYRHRVHVQHHEVAALLRPGVNVWAVELADGWWSGYLGMDRRHQAGVYGDTPSFRGALVCRAAERTQTVLTGEGWLIGTGHIRYADLLMGQMTDLSAEPLGWSTAPDVSHLAEFAPAWCDEALGVRLDPQRGPSIRATGSLPPVRIDALPGGRHLVDFGQNLVGRVRLQLRSVPPGTRIHIRHGEALSDGELYTENLRTARAHDIIVADGADRDVEPAFTFHGFRYAELRGHPGPLEPDDIRAIVIGSDVHRVGSFACSDPRLEQLERNIAWTIRGNLVSVPTDCPQRDERLGWMGDAQLIMRTANAQFDVAEFIGKWLVDIRDGQSEDGAYPDVAPRIVVDVDGSPGWADAGVLVPWTTALYTGRIDLLEEHRESMERFMSSLERDNPSGIREHALQRNYGDWVSLGPPTPKTLVATAYSARCADALAASARLTGEDPARWEALADRIRTAFRGRFVGDDGLLHDETQTAYALAIMCGLLSEGDLGRAGARLASLIDAAGGALDTGIHGLRHLLPALTVSGQLDCAYRVLLREGHPGWLAQLAAGATTVWERWDGWTPEQGFQTPAMNSFNHYAFGSVGEWMYEWMGGLRPDPASPGFAHAVIRPHPGGGVTHCRVERTLPAGMLAVEWRIRDGVLRLEVEVPPGHTARVHVPVVHTRATAGEAERHSWDTYDVQHGRHRFESPFDGDWAPAARVDWRGEA
ncbi:alpha-L-rhamnosidase [Salinibacterium sp. ZJ70]|uniref:alpha-L-rhamnosidase n=1 Tax=Salinibacterium sp. ZJ70 TaxID=2708084 RepID=UPI0014241D03|nr:alpha-L-rhamnosidase [Salinibacterium sp. ZJ70]